MNSKSALHNPQNVSEIPQIQKKVVKSLNKLINKPACIVNKIDLAESYSRMGFDVFACAVNSKKPFAGSNGLSDATTDLDQIRAWWTTNPEANPAIRTGGDANLFVFDVEPEALEWSRSGPIADELEDLWQVKTRRGGIHFYTRLPKDVRFRNSVTKIAASVDTRGDGGYVMSPGAVVDGNEYEIIQGFEEGSGICDIPMACTKLIDFVRCEFAKANSDRSQNIGESNPIPEGQRNHAMTSLAGTMRRAGMGYKAILAAFREENNRCIPPLDESELVKIAGSVCRYEPDTITVAMVENHWAQMVESGEIKNNGPDDPGPLPVKLLRVPGFISQVIDFCLETAPYPNHVMAFCGALAMQAMLAGRKVRDSVDCRTNLYLLGLGHSASGKDWPRKVNDRIALEAGLIDAIGDGFASGEGIEDLMHHNNTMLFQTDEIDGMLLSVNRAKESRYENIMTALLKFYSSANGIYKMRVKAGHTCIQPIHQPCLVLFGTAIPNHYYEALSSRMLSNGFFARMLVLESRKRSEGQSVSHRELPDGIVETAKYWAQLDSDDGNLSSFYPKPAVVEATAGAEKAIEEARLMVDEEYGRSEDKADVVATAVWGRAVENIRKLSLIFAVSEKPMEPQISVQGVRWATELVTHQVRRMLFMAESHVAENPFHAECLKVVNLLRQSPNGELPHSKMLRRMRCGAESLQKYVETLSQQGDIDIVDRPTATRMGRHYRLLCA